MRLLALAVVLVGCATIPSGPTCPPVPQMTAGANYKDMVVCGELQSGDIACIPLTRFLDEWLKENNQKVLVAPDAKVDRL